MPRVSNRHGRLSVSSPSGPMRRLSGYASTAAGLASSLGGMVTALLFFGVVGIFGTFDEEWETVIWRMQIGGTEVAIWKEYALLVALPVSAVAFLLGQWLGRKPSPVLPPATARRVALEEAA